MRPHTWGRGPTDRLLRAAHVCALALVALLPCRPSWAAELVLPGDLGPEYVIAWSSLDLVDARLALAVQRFVDVESIACTGGSLCAEALEQREKTSKLIEMTGAAIADAQRELHLGSVVLANQRHQDAELLLADAEYLLGALEALASTGVGANAGDVRVFAAVVILAEGLPLGVSAGPVTAGGAAVPSSGAIFGKWVTLINVVVESPVVANSIGSNGWVAVDDLTSLDGQSYWFPKVNVLLAPIHAVDPSTVQIEGIAAPTLPSRVERGCDCGATVVSALGATDIAVKACDLLWCVTEVENGDARLDPWFGDCVSVTEDCDGVDADVARWRASGPEREFFGEFVDHVAALAATVPHARTDEFVTLLADLFDQRIALEKVAEKTDVADGVVLADLASEGLSQLQGAARLVRAVIAFGETLRPVPKYERELGEFVLPIGTLVAAVDVPTAIVPRPDWFEDACAETTVGTGRRVWLTDTIVDSPWVVDHARQDPVLGSGIYRLDGIERIDGSVYVEAGWAFADVLAGPPRSEGGEFWIPGGISSLVTDRAGGTIPTAPCGDVGPCGPCEACVQTFGCDPPGGFGGPEPVPDPRAGRNLFCPDQAGRAPSEFVPALGPCYPTPEGPAPEPGGCFECAPDPRLAAGGDCDEPPPLSEVEDQMCATLFTDGRCDPTHCDPIDQGWVGSGGLGTPYSLDAGYGATDPMCDLAQWGPDGGPPAHCDPGQQSRNRQATALLRFSDRPLEHACSLGILECTELESGEFVVCSDSPDSWGPSQSCAVCDVDTGECESASVDTMRAVAPWSTGEEEPDHGSGTGVDGEAEQTPEDQTDPRRDAWFCPTGGGRA